MTPLRDSRITPNQVTTASLVAGLVAAGLYARGGAAAHLGALLFVLSFWLDHADGELARLTGRTSAFGHYYDLAAGGAVLVALFAGIGIGLRDGALGGRAPLLGLLAGLAIAAIFTLRLDLERARGKAATRQPNRLGFELEDVMYLVGPVTWAGALAPFLILAAIGTPLFALWVSFVRWRLTRAPA